MRTKKKLFAAALAICLLSTISFSTLAWFNATESVTNKFMVASTGSGAGGGTAGENVFSVDLWEKVDSDGDGDVDVDDTKVGYRNKLFETWKYDDILPGVEYHKEPIIENTGSYDQYIRVVVTLSDASKWIKTDSSDDGVLDAGYDLSKIFLGYEVNTWTRDTSIKLTEGSTVDAIVDIDEDTISYVYYLEGVLPYAAKVPADENDHMVSLFKAVKLPEHLTQEDVAKLVDTDGTVDFNIGIRADAIQTKGIKDPATDEEVTSAKAAFEAIGWTADKQVMS